MKPSLADLVELHLAKALRRRRRPRHITPRSPRSPPACGSPTLRPSPSLTRTFRDEDFDPADLSTEFVAVPGAMMADAEDGEQPWGPPLFIPGLPDRTEVELQLEPSALCRPRRRAA